MRVSLFVAAALLCACSNDQTEAPRADDALDCVFVRNSSGENCWANMAAVVEKCLGASTSTGALAADALSCAYDDGRAVTSTVAMGQESDDSPVRDFSVSSGAGVNCVHVTEANHVVTVTYGSGTVTLSSGGDPVVLTCPDGKVYKGSKAGLQACLSPASGVPGYYWSNERGDGGTTLRATFGLLGAKTPLYACQLKSAT